MRPTNQPPDVLVEIVTPDAWNSCVSTLAPFMRHATGTLATQKHVRPTSLLGGMEIMYCRLRDVYL